MAVIAGAWIVVVIAEATGKGSLLHHHALIESGPPLWVALALFLIGWQVMIAAMMLPASLPAIRVFTAAARKHQRPGQAGVLALAGAYQFAPHKRRGLAACRHPIAAAAPAPSQGLGAFQLGLEHGFACLGSSWALMLVMFAAGVANLWWMVGLTGVMVYETTGRHGHRAASVTGVVLIASALLVAVSGMQAVVLTGVVWK